MSKACCVLFGTKRVVQDYLHELSLSYLKWMRVSNSPKRNKSFKFFNYCSNYPNFHKIIIDV
ncbi:unnamed protein product [Musa acuminata subsp. malaccensis]|uniref:(wild Malaysian banana) hypothetical protein n=1 Tax=Musa acuminata subsp. malaccensis TaxID=214687 RepID=A0A804IRD1_MUSAM|nr:unnamed protein product [Musa acuminata subsp. malaccensis]